MINGIKKYGRVLVIDDGSSDQTKKIALKNGAMVLSHKKNLGYNQAINSGLKFFLKKKFKQVITIDADGQLPTIYIKIFKKALDSNVDIVCGVRAKVNRIGEKIFLFFSKTFWNLQDPLCGMKAYSFSFIKEYYEEPNFDSINTELLIKGKKNNAEIKELLVDNKSRKDESRFGKGISVNLFIIFTFFKCLILIK